MISARRRSRQLAMNRISVAKNSRNSAKVGDRNSSVGCTHSNFGSWKARQPLRAAEHGLQLLPQRQRPVEDVHLVLQLRAQFRQARAPFHRWRGDQRDDEGDHGGHRDHDQHGAEGARHMPPLEEARGRRQHGAGDERHHDREEERLGDIEHGDDGDQEQTGERKGDELGAADHRRQLDMAVGKRVALAVAGSQTFTGKDAHNTLLRARKPVRAPIAGSRTSGRDVPVPSRLREELLA